MTTLAEHLQRVSYNTTLVLSIFIASALRYEVDLTGLFMPAAALPRALGPKQCEVQPGPPRAGRGLQGAPTALLLPSSGHGEVLEHPREMTAE